jgi:hypothetical protein
MKKIYYIFSCVPHPLMLWFFQLGKIDEQIKMERFPCQMVISSDKISIKKDSFVHIWEKEKIISFNFYHYFYYFLQN